MEGVTRKDDWANDPRAKEFYEACPFCGSKNYFGPEIGDHEGSGGDILIRYGCEDCGENWNYWYTFLGACWRDLNQRVVERLREQGKVVIVTDEIQ